MEGVVFVGGVGGGVVVVGVCRYLRSMVGIQRRGETIIAGYS